MPCCFLVSKQTRAGTFPTTLFSVLSIHMPWEMDWGEMQGLAWQCKVQILAYFTARGGRSLSYPSPPHQKYEQICQVTDSWTWGSQEQVLPHSPPWTCPSHTCSPSGPPSPRVTPRLGQWMFEISPGFTSWCSGISSPVNNMGKGHQVQSSASHPIPSNCHPSLPCVWLGHLYKCHDSLPLFPPVSS